MIKTGTYPLSLIHRRKGSWLHVGSNPTVPTNRTKKIMIYEHYHTFFELRNYLYINKYIYG